MVVHREWWSARQGQFMQSCKGRDHKRWLQKCQVSVVCATTMCKFCLPEVLNLCSLRANFIWLWRFSISHNSDTLKHPIHMPLILVSTFHFSHIILFNAVQRGKTPLGNSYTSHIVFRSLFICKKTSQFERCRHKHLHILSSQSVRIVQAGSNASKHPQWQFTDISSDTFTCNQHNQSALCCNTFYAPAKLSISQNSASWNALSNPPGGAN